VGKPSLSLKNLRELSGLTQQQIGFGVGIDRSNLSMIETGLLKTDAETMQKIRRFLFRAIVKRRAKLDAVLASAGIIPVKQELPTE